MNGFALILGVAGFVVAHVLNGMLLAFVYRTPDPEISPMLALYFEYGFWLLFVIPGLVAAYSGRTRRILHGFTAGLIVGGLAVLFAVFVPESGESMTTFAALRVIVIAVSLSTLGGGIAHFWRSRPAQ